MKRFYGWNEEIMLSRTRLVCLCLEEPRIPPVEFNEMLSFLIREAVIEVRQGEDWEQKSWTTTLGCARGGRAQNVLAVIIDVGQLFHNLIYSALIFFRG